jgi:hypothetical protein
MIRPPYLRDTRTRSVRVRGDSVARPDPRTLRDTRTRSSEEPQLNAELTPVAAGAMLAGDDAIILVHPSQGEFHLPALRDPGAGQRLHQPLPAVPVVTAR